ncbi:MAG TPA: hypothetical protein DCQ92_12990 [Verrucomicrobia subdivision 3 bacterium]|nr:hypothetical protein [Limisphaerales bacterium]
MKTRIQTLKTKLLLPLVAVGLALAVQQANAQTTIAKWTFESATTSGSLTNTSTTNFFAEAGTQAGIAAVTGKHLGVATYSTPAGNGSAKSLSANGWTNIGDYYQVAVSTVSYTNIGISFDAVGSATGPRDFIVKYSTDGVNFTQFGSAYTVLSSPSWSAGTPQVGETYTYDLSSITSLANVSTVYFRLVVNSTNNIGGGSGGGVGTGGTSRIDNINVLGTIAGPPQIITQPPNTTNFFGDTATITVVAGGDAPLSYQWFTNSMPLTALTDGSSGYGSGTIAGTISSTLTLTFLNTNQTGDYRVVVSNPRDSVTSSVVHVQVNVRPTIVTNIAYLHKLNDANFALTDKTNVYQVDGIVTTIGNLVSGTTEVESFYVQDGTGGVDVFYRGGFSFPNTGDHVRITAPLDQFNGGLEMAPINGNPSHTIENLGTGAVPDPQFFNFTTLPTSVVMEETNEGRYMVVSNVFLAVTNADAHLVGNEIIFMTNLTGQVFRMIVANNPVLGPVGYALPGSFATSVRGVMSQSQTSGTVLTNGYSLILTDFSQIEVGTPPVIVNPIPLNIQLSGANVVLTWSDASFNLQSATNVVGPYSNIPAAAGQTTYTDAITNQANFYRLQHP